MMPFHVIVRARPNAELPSQRVLLGQRYVDTLLVPEHLQTMPLGVSFEVAVTGLETLPHMFIEPDGSFVWVSPHGLPHSESGRWQVDGNLYDRQSSLVSIDLKGTCPSSELAALLRSCRGARVELMFELVREAVFVAEPDFWLLVNAATDQQSG